VAQLEAVVKSMASAACRANVRLLVGDTKVVERGRGDGVFVTTTALGTLPTCSPWHAGRVQEGDAVLVSGDVGRHGAAVLAARGQRLLTDVEGSPLTSDVSSVWPCVSQLLGFSGSITWIRALSGGLATTLLELVEQTGVSVHVSRAQVPVSQAVTSACETLQLDPLHLASHGRVVMAVRPEAANAVLAQLKRFEPTAAIIGRVTQTVDDTPQVRLEQTSGTERILERRANDSACRVC
jgi:hydrogenase expression/formation protein HypE